MYTENSNSYYFFFDNLNLFSFVALKFMTGVNGNILVELCRCRVLTPYPHLREGEIRLAELLREEVHFTRTRASIFLLHACCPVLR